MGGEPADERLRLLESAVVHARDAVVVTEYDASGEPRIVLVNPAFTAQTGYPSGEVVGRHPRLLVGPETNLDAQVAPRRAAAARRPVTAEHLRYRPDVIDPVRFRMAHADGSWVPVEATANNLLGDPDIEGVVVITRDISERKRVEDELAYQALHDPLTGLPNRTLLADRLDQALAASRRRGRSVGLLLMDLDRFKEINDTLGHRSGDHVLEQVARRLEKVLRGSDTVARLGGDEFAVVLADVDGVGEAELVTTKVLEALAAPFDLSGLALHVDASVGIAVAPTHADDSSLLLQRADVAMYRAKSVVQGYAVYAADTDENRLQRLALMA